MHARRRAALRTGIATAGVLLALAPATASAGSEGADAQARALERMRGRTCTPATCAPRPPSPLRQLAGFGSAVGLCWLAARRRPRD